MIELYDIVELIDDYKPEDYNGKLYVEMAGTVIETYDKKCAKWNFHC